MPPELTCMAGVDEGGAEGRVPYCTVPGRLCAGLPVCVPACLSDYQLHCSCLSVCLTVCLCQCQCICMCVCVCVCFCVCVLLLDSRFRVRGWPGEVFVEGRKREGGKREREWELPEWIDGCRITLLLSEEVFV